MEGIAVTNNPEQVIANVTFRDDAVIVEEQLLPARGTSNIVIGPAGVISEELVITPLEPTALP